MRAFNFSAGPAVLPEPVLRQAAAEMLDWRGSGMSVMEMSHRSATYERIIQETEQNIRKLAGIPEDYAVLFLQGGATTQFAMVPMNLTRNGKADYLISGHWAQKAAEEATRFTDVRIALSSEGDAYRFIPDLSGYQPQAGADYVHICENNTIFGTQYHALPETGAVPLVADQSSCVFSAPLDITRYGLIYAGTQKNIGPAGLTLVIIRKDLIREDLPSGVPLMLRYLTHQKSGSMHNTPPTYAIYICGLVIRWLLDQGGLTKAAERNLKKAALLYEALDGSRLFRGIADPATRSNMNVTFTSGNKETDAEFVKGAEAIGLSGLKGYRTLGGMRASLYNAMPHEGVVALVAYMKEFERVRS